MRTAPTPLDRAALTAALALPDLTDPANGAHALQVLVDEATAALAALWRVPVDLRRAEPIVAVEDNYDRLGYSPDAASRASRYARYVSDTCMLRAHTSAGVPPALRALAGMADPPGDVVLALPGLVYRRDSIDRLHTGTPHQLDLWRVARGVPALGLGDLDDMIGAVLGALIPHRAWRSEPTEHPYTEGGRELLVDDEALRPSRPAREDRTKEDRTAHRVEATWVEVGECGLAAPAVLARCGLDPAAWSGLAMGVGLDRLLMLRKGLPDIRLLRSADPRVRRQLADLDAWRPVSSHPAVVRDVSVSLDTTATDEDLGDIVREALGEDADAVEEVTLRAATAAEHLPTVAAARLGITAGQVNALVRIVLRHPDRSLTRAEANDLRDRVHTALDRSGR